MTVEEQVEAAGQILREAWARRGRHPARIDMTVWDYRVETHGHTDLAGDGPALLLPAPPAPALPVSFGCNWRGRRYDVDGER